MFFTDTGFNVTFQEVFSVKLILRGLRRILGDAPVQKLPMTPGILLKIHPQLTARSDSGFWAMARYQGQN